MGVWFHLMRRKHAVRVPHDTLHHVPTGSGTLLPAAESRVLGGKVMVTPSRTASRSHAAGADKLQDTGAFFA
jgi:hypothetical protein